MMSEDKASKLAWSTRETACEVLESRSAPHPYFRSLSLVSPVRWLCGYSFLN